MNIRPNPCMDNKAFLARPSGQRNTSFGAKKFIKLETLNKRDYVKDDTVFICVTVDHSELSDFV